MIERAFIEQGIRHVELDQYLKSKLNRAGFTKSEIVKTPLVTRIVVNVVSPGLAIGKGGETIRSLTEGIKTRFGIDNPQLEIKEISQPNLDAHAVTDRIVAAVERGFSWRSVCFRIIREVMASGAKGIEIIVKGVIAGKGQRKRKVRLITGYMKKVGDQANLVDSAKKSAITKIGAIGFKIRIVHPDVQFMDKIDMTQFSRDKHLVAKPEAADENKSTEKNGVSETAVMDDQSPVAKEAQAQAAEPIETKPIAAGKKAKAEKPVQEAEKKKEQEAIEA